MGAVKKTALGIGGGFILLTGALAAPVIWTEAACRGETEAQIPAAVLTDPTDQRPEARTAFVVPEWEIVYAYEDLGQSLNAGLAHKFDYWRAITGFWDTACAVRSEADRLGEVSSDAKTTIYTIGVSFTLEMAMKAAYEETLGRMVALLGGADTRQDVIEREMAQTYGAFLHQTPWYLFPFDEWTEKLWEAPVENTIRGWERRLALGGEWKAKAAYAGVIENAVSSMEPDKVTMKVHVSGIEQSDISGMAHARFHAALGDGIILDVDRYRHFTHTAQEIADLGGDFTEIAGNDDILVSLIADDLSGLPLGARVLRKTVRQDGLADRLLVAVKVSELADLIRHLDETDLRLEHIYDY